MFTWKQRRGAVDRTAVLLYSLARQSTEDVPVRWLEPALIGLRWTHLNSLAYVSNWYRRTSSMNLPSSLDNAGISTPIVTSFQSLTTFVPVWNVRPGRISSVTVILGRSLGHCSAGLDRTQVQSTKEGSILSPVSSGKQSRLDWSCPGWSAILLAWGWSVPHSPGYWCTPDNFLLQFGSSSGWCCCRSRTNVDGYCGSDG